MLQPRALGVPGDDEAGAQHGMAHAQVEEEAPAERPRRLRLKPARRLPYVEDTAVQEGR